jgi:hypothetical protein
MPVFSVILALRLPFANLLEVSRFIAENRRVARRKTEDSVFILGVRIELRHEWGDVGSRESFIGNVRPERSQA